MVRKRAIFALLIAGLLIAVLGYFSRDRTLERALESTGEAIAGAKVEIDGFHFSFWRLRGSWRRLQVANRNNPWRNILETGPAALELEWRPLFWRRFIIREMRLENVRSGTRRSSDGSLPREAAWEPPEFVQRAIDAAKEQVAALPVFDVSGLGKTLKVDSLVDPNKLASVQAFRNVQSEADSTYTFWQEALQVEPYERQVQEIQAEIDALQLDKIKDAAALLAATPKIKQVVEKVNRLQKEIAGKKDALQGSYKTLQAQLVDAKKLVDSDVNKALRLARLAKFDTRDMALLLLGQPVVQRIEQILRYIGVVRQYLPTAQAMLATTKTESPPRFLGQDIPFPFHYRYPRVLVRRLTLSGATATGDTSRAYFVSGTVQNLTTEPPVLGRPTRFDLQVSRVEGRGYSLTGSLDHTGDVAKDSLWAQASNMPLGRIALAPSTYFPQAIDLQKADIRLQGLFIGDAIDLEMGLDAASVAYDFGDGQPDRIGQMVRDALAGMERLRLTAQFTGQGGDYGLRLRSNFDRAVASSIQGVLEKNVAEARQQVEKSVRAESGKRQAELTALITKQETVLQEQVDQIAALVQEQVDALEKQKQELEQRVGSESAAAKKAVDDAKKSLEGLFKKKKN